MATETLSIKHARPVPSLAALRRRLSGLGTTLFLLTVAAMLYQGWRLHGEHYLDAEKGWGYALGIIGGTFMLLLLLYPLRKRWKAMRRLGAVKHWFRLHMILGILGPSAILFHANFQLGALNSNVALFCMLIVSSSGLAGRYFYSKIHHGLYGSQATLQEVREASALSKDHLMNSLSALPRLKEQLQAWETAALQPTPGLLATAVRVSKLVWSTPFIYRRLWNTCSQTIAAEITDAAAQRLAFKQTRLYLRDYLVTVRRVVEFDFYAKLFSLWHVLHLPLFVMLLITGIVHVIAVHLY